MVSSSTYTTLAETLASDIREPRPENRTRQRSQYKQVARILCHLRNELREQTPQLDMPSNWMISCLVYNVWNGIETRPGDWQGRVVDVLQAIRTQTNVGLERPCHFVQPDGLTPLFPNADAFDEWDAYRFSQALLYHLEKDLN